MDVEGQVRKQGTKKSPLMKIEGRMEGLQGEEDKKREKEELHCIIRESWESKIAQGEKFYRYSLSEKAKTVVMFIISKKKAVVYLDAL